MLAHNRFTVANHHQLKLDCWSGLMMKQQSLSWQQMEFVKPKESVKLHVAAPKHDCETAAFQVDETGWLVTQDPSMKNKLDKLRQWYPNIDFDTLQNVLAAHEGCMQQTKQVGAHLGQLKLALAV